MKDKLMYLFLGGFISSIINGIVLFQENDLMLAQKFYMPIIGIIGSLFIVLMINVVKDKFNKNDFIYSFIGSLISYASICLGLWFSIYNI